MACSQRVLQMPCTVPSQPASTLRLFHRQLQSGCGDTAYHGKTLSPVIHRASVPTTCFQLNSCRVQSAAMFLRGLTSGEATPPFHGGMRLRVLRLGWRAGLARFTGGSFSQSTTVFSAYRGLTPLPIRQLSSSSGRALFSKTGRTPAPELRVCDGGCRSVWELSSASSRRLDGHQMRTAVSFASRQQPSSSGRGLSSCQPPRLAVRIFGGSGMSTPARLRAASPLQCSRGMAAGSRFASPCDLDDLRRLTMELYRQQPVDRLHEPSARGNRPETAPRQRTKFRASRRPAGGVEESVSGEPGGIRRGMLVEFKRDGKEPSLGVAKKPEGKKSWVVMDQYGNESLVRPAQITHVVRDTENLYTPADIARFGSKAGAIQDLSLLEPAWEELVAEGRSVDGTELAEILYNSSGPLEVYASHRMLTLDRVYFKSTSNMFKPNSPSQVAELKQQVLAERAAAKVLAEYVERVRAAVSVPPGKKPPPESWDSGGKRVRAFTEAIRSVAVNVPERFPVNDFVAQEVFRALGVGRTPEKARDLLIGMGIWPRHVNLALMRSAFCDPFPPSVEAAAAAVQTGDPSPDPDASRRVDFSGHKIFTIDSEDTVEIDDGLSIERTSDGRTRVWIHVADPTRWVQPGDPIDMEAQRRCTSVYLPTGPVTMFPYSLASGRMSLIRGTTNCAMSIGVTLSDSVEIDHVEIVNSYVCPTYRLTFEETNEILSWGMDSEAEMLALMDVAEARYRLRMSKSAVNICIPRPKMHVRNPDDESPDIQVGVEGCGYSPARRLVEELMVLCGEAVAQFGAQHRLPLPYRGQAQSPLPDTSDLPPGPCRAAVLRMHMGRSETNCESPIAHAALGLEGYVQFTSPIRRYGDLIAHYVIKACLRGDPLPFTGPDIQRVMSVARFYNEEARRIEQACQRYWIAEFLRQRRHQPFKALVLRWIKQGSNALVLLSDFGLELQMSLVSRVELGDEIDVMVMEVHPHNGVLAIAEAPQSMVESSARWNELPSSFVMQ